ncbi:conjugal transfer protein TrbL [Paramicrobacterium chengjingii]|uniref:conjugal transfer protein TrbL n=1 Tax=Paramicrobacterium chengjingii TaxID=2769067 RepID=UPI0014222A5C|nr:conjugal transfer protein TrbL [Microbacterium chengjingii]
MGVCDVPVISTVCDVAGEAAATVVAAPFDWLAQAMGGAAGWLIEAMWSVFDTTTLVDVQTDGFTSVYNLIFGIAVFLVLIFFCLQLITGMIRRDPNALSRAALGAAKSVLGAFVVITLTALALEIVDQLCIGIIQASGETTGTMGDKIVLLAAGLSGINIAAPGVGAIITIFLAGLMIAAVAIVWFSLLIRKALLLVGVVLAPIAFAGASWDATKGWIGKWAAFVIALIVSKLVLVVIFLLAITQIATPIEVDIAAVTEPITGIVLMGIAAFAPYMVYRFVSFLGFDLYQQMGTEQEAKNALNRPLPMPSKPQGGGDPQKVLGESKGGGGSGSTSSPTQAATADTAAGTTEASAGSGAGAGAGAAAAPPAAAVIVGAQIVKGAAEAGPEAGQELAGQAETSANGADGQSDAGAPPPSSTPQPRTPPASQPTPSATEEK